jgi:hypothetical protein
MNLLSSFSIAALYSGLFYLLGIVLYSLFAYDLSIADPTCRQNAFDHYTSRKESISYKIVPVACVLLTTGVFANVYLEGGSAASVMALLAAFLTAFNNGRNVVNPVNALTADAKGDKQDLALVLSGVARGHFIDAFGFSLIFLCATFL